MAGQNPSDQGQLTGGVQPLLEGEALAKYSAAVGTLPTSSRNRCQTSLISSLTLSLGDLQPALGVDLAGRDSWSAGARPDPRSGPARA